MTDQDTKNHDDEYSSTSAQGCYAHVIQGVSRLVPFCDRCFVEMSFVELGRKREYRGYECPCCGRVMSLEAWSILLLSVNEK